MPGMPRRAERARAGAFGGAAGGGRGATLGARVRVHRCVTPLPGFNIRVDTCVAPRDLCAACGDAAYAVVGARPYCRAHHARLTGPPPVVEREQGAEPLDVRP